MSITVPIGVFRWFSGWGGKKGVIFGGFGGGGGGGGVLLGVFWGFLGVISIFWRNLGLSTEIYP